MHKIAVGITAVSMTALMAAPAFAQSATITKIADTSTQVPGESIGTTFDNFSPPAIGGNTVGFRGFNPGKRGAYKATIGSAPVVVADSNTVDPTSLNNFNNFGSTVPIDDNGNASFGAQSSGNQGVYKIIGGTLTVVADTLATTIPGETVNFGNVGFTPISNGNIAFSGRDTNTSPTIEGIYTDNGGSLAAVADLATAIPSGSGVFTDLPPCPAGACNGLDFNNGNVAFGGLGTSSQQGIYTTLGGTLRRVAAKGMTLPGIGVVTGFGGNSPAIDGDDVLFIADSGADRAIFVENQNSIGTFALIADNLSTPIPDGSGNFTQMGVAGIDEGFVAFRGFGTSQDGIYTTLGGTLRKVVDLSDIIDGKTVSSFGVNRYLISGNKITFQANFTDSSKGIFVAEVPVGPEFECVGFEPPMDNPPVTVKKNRALPLKATLFDEFEFLVTDMDVVSPPVLQVIFSSALGDPPIDVTEDALPAGQSSEGNIFSYDFGSEQWRYNLKTTNYSASGSYTIRLVSGDDDEYIVEPACETTFVIE